MAKKINKKLLSEELKRFNLICEYSFYTGDSENIDEDDTDQEDQNLDKATQDIASDLGVDDSKTANGGDVPQDSPEAPGDASNANVQNSAQPETTPEQPETSPEQPVGSASPIEEPSGEVDVDVTSLVNQSKDTEEAIEVTNHKTDVLLSKFQELEQKISGMSRLSNKIETLEKEIIKRNPTPVEKLEMRSLSSYPYNIKLTDFWDDTKDNYEAINDKKDEYVLTQDDVDSDYMESNVKKSFDLDDFEEEEI